jgi:hypothetical protein
MHAFRKVFDWLQAGGPNSDVTPPAAPAPASKPAFALFPDEVASAEKRFVPRQPLTADGEIATGMFALPDPIVLRDFSNRGMYFYTGFKPAVGQIIQITMQDPEINRRVRYSAKVVRTENGSGQDRFGIGVAITRREIIDGAP